MMRQCIYSKIHGGSENMLADYWCHRDEIEHPDKRRPTLLHCKLYDKTMYCATHEQFPADYDI